MDVLTKIFNDNGVKRGINKESNGTRKEEWMLENELAHNDDLRGPTKKPLELGSRQCYGRQRDRSAR